MSKITTRLFYYFQRSFISSADCVATSLLIIAHYAKIRNSEATRELSSIIVKRGEPLQPFRSVNLFCISVFLTLFRLFFYHSTKKVKMSTRYLKRHKRQLNDIKKSIK